MYDVAAVLQPVSSAIDAKLGRCARCMRLSAAATAASWVLVAAAAALGSAIGQALALAGAVPLTILSLAHAIAYVVREPATSGCTPCQRKARERARLARRRRVKAWFAAPRLRTTRRASRGCIDCTKTLSPEELIAQADRLPSANEQILDVIHASPAFQQVTSLLTQPRPVDSWMADMRHHFVFELRPTDDGRGRHALFAARWEDYGVASALLITESRDGGDPIVTDIRAVDPERVPVAF